MVESTKKKAERAKVAAVPDLGENDTGPQETEDVPGHRSSACPVALCPICTLVNLIQPLNPDVVEHLLKAGREFLLAAKAILDAMAAPAATGGGGSLEKIDIG